MDQSNVGSPSTLTGALAAALTPMDDRLNPDHPALLGHCRRLLNTGCHGIVLFGSTGEAVSLSVDERRAALESLLDRGIPGGKLVVGTGSCALTDTISLSRTAMEADAAGVLVLPPFYYTGVSDDGLFRYFAEVIERIADDRLKLYLYHIPQATGVDLSFAVIERLLKRYSHAVVGMKDSSADQGHITAACREFPELAVFTGTERYLLDTLRYGGAGCVSATINLIPHPAIELHDLYTRSSGTVTELQARLTDMREMIEGDSAGYPIISILKGALRLLTGDEEWLNLRPPLLAPNVEQARALLTRLPESALIRIESE